MTEEDRRAAIAVWEEIVRTAALIRGYNPTLEQIEERLLDGSLTGEDANAMRPIVDDALILVALIEQLDRRRALAFA